MIVYSDFITHKPLAQFESDRLYEIRFADNHTDLVKVLCCDGLGYIVCKSVLTKEVYKIHGKDFIKKAKPTKYIIKK